VAERLLEYRTFKWQESRDFSWTTDNIEILLGQKNKTPFLGSVKQNYADTDKQLC
jgi:hypothetical protein